MTQIQCAAICFFPTGVNNTDDGINMAVSYIASGTESQKSSTNRQMKWDQKFISSRNNVWFNGMTFLHKKSMYIHHMHYDTVGIMPAH